MARLVACAFTYDDPTQDTGLGVHVFDLPAATLAPSTTIVFTLFWPQHQRWEGTDFAVEVVGPNEPPSGH